MKKGLAVGLGLLIGVGVCNVLKTETSTSPEVKTPQIVLTPKETTLLNIILADDIKAFVNGKPSTYGDSVEASQYVIVNAQTFQRDYEKNEVAGDLKYRGQKIIFQGQVASVDRGIGEDCFIQFKGTDMFSRPRAQMAKGFMAYLADLTKGQTATLVCKGAGMLLGSALLSDCTPFQTWLVKTVKSRATAMISHVDLVGVAELVTVMAIARALPESSSCWSGGGSCDKEMEKALDAKDWITPEVFNEIAGRLHKTPDELRGLLIN